MIRAVQTVTKCVTNVLANEGKAGALSLILSPKGGQVRAIKSTALGNSANAGAIKGNVLFGLITQRSKVQILPPQPTDSREVIYDFRTSRSGATCDSLLVTHSFVRAELVTARWAVRSLGDDWKSLVP